MSFSDWQEPARLLDEFAGPPTEEQLDVAVQVGFSFVGEPRVVLAAAIEAWLRPAIWQEQPLLSTERQQDFLRELGYSGDVTELSRSVASAWIQHYLALRTADELRMLRPKRGDVVDHQHRFVDFTTGEVHAWYETQTVSSIGRTGQIYFRGGNGRCGWPSQIVHSGTPQPGQGESEQTPEP